MPPELRVLFVCMHDFTGPSEKQMLGFAQRLIPRGHRVLFSLGHDADSARFEGVDGIDGIEVVEHRFAGSRLRAVDRRAAQAFAPTLIHAVNSRIPTAWAARDYARATGAPVFVHFEDDEWRAWRGVPGESLYHRVGRIVHRLQAGRRPADWPHSTMRSRLWVRRRALALDALTPALSTEVQQRFGRPCTTIFPVSPEPRGPGATEAALLALPGALNDLPLAVVTGTIWPFSLEDTLQGMRAVAEVQSRGHRLGYVHPGNVHPRIDPARLGDEAGLAPGTFVFPGLLPFADMGPLLRRGTVLLQPGGPSEFNRLRLPSKLQAYLASGTPTITFATGFGELLTDREEVLKIHSGDPGELADRIVEVIEDPQLRATLAAGGPRAAERWFDPERNTDALVAHYRAYL